MSGQKRWTATATYRMSPCEFVEVPHDIEELEELQPLIERGPDWRALETITIVLNRGEPICLPAVPHA